MRKWPERDFFGGGEGVNWFLQTYPWRAPNFLVHYSYFFCEVKVSLPLIIFYSWACNCPSSLFSDFAITFLVTFSFSH